MKDERLYLLRIQRSIARIEAYTKGGKEDFFTSEFVQDAVLRNLQILAESTQRLSVVTKEANPQIPWREISGFRNKIAHDYFDVNLDTIWDVIEGFLPPLRDCVSAILAQRDGTDVSP